MIVLALILFALNFLDLFLTVRGVQAGVAKEANPVLVPLVNRIGIGPTMALKMCAAVAVVYYGYWSGSLLTLALCCAGYLWICWHNWRVLRRK